MQIDNYCTNSKRHKIPLALRIGEQKNNGTDEAPQSEALESKLLLYLCLQYFPFMHLEILFEDNHMLAINKPAGLMVEKDKYNNPSVEGEVEAYFKEKKMSKNTIVGIVHRLDRPVSGTLLIAKKISVLRDLNAQFSAKQITKKYFAVVHKKPKELKATLSHWLTKDTMSKKAIISDEQVKGSTACQLKYEVVSQSTNKYLLAIELITGKYHQIRAQLAYIGCPIIGDERYGSKVYYRPNQICLHAKELTVTHPTTKETIKFVAEFPDHDYWKK